MAFDIAKIDIWVGELPDRPRALQAKLEVLAGAGANLEFVIARRGGRGKAVVFMAPIKGAAQIRAAEDACLKKAESMYALRIEGPNQAGLGERITRALADAGLNLHGVSAAAIGGRSVTYVRFASTEALRAARQALHRELR